MALTKVTSSVLEAAQTNITSVGTLTTLTVDNVIINGTTIGHTSDTDLMTLADGVLTVAGEVDATSLDISGNVDIDGTLETDNLTVGGAQGSDGQVLTSTGSGVAWEDASGGVAGISSSADATAMTIDSNERVLIGYTTSSLQTDPTAKLVLGGNLTANAETTMIHFDGMGARGTGTGQTIDFSMGRSNVTPDIAKAQIVALTEGGSATAASHGIGFEFTTGDGDSQGTPLRIRASGGVIKFNTSEQPQSGNPRTGQAIVIGPSTQGGITQGLTNATVLQNRSGELYAVDSSHNNTQITPHNWGLISSGPSEELAWTYYSQRPNPSNNEQMQTINVDMAKVVRKVEDLVGEKLIYTENSDKDGHTFQTIISDIQTTLADLKTRVETLEG